MVKWKILKFQYDITFKEIEIRLDILKFKEYGRKYGRWSSEIYFGWGSFEAYINFLEKSD